MLKRAVVPLLAVVCFSMQDVKNEGCRVLCIRDGYSTGTYATSTDQCSCSDLKKYNDLTRKQANLGPIEMHPMTPEDKELGMVAPFKSTIKKGSILNNTTSSYSDYYSFED